MKNQELNEKDCKLVEQVGLIISNELAELAEKKFRECGAFSNTGELADIIKTKKRLVAFTNSVLTSFVAGFLNALGKSFSIPRSVLYDFFDDMLISTLKIYDEQEEKESKQESNADDIWSF
jgi:hypothetical protein